MKNLLAGYDNYIKIFGLNIALYSVFVILGFIVAFLLCNWRWRKQKLNTKELDNFFFGAILIAIAGARIWYAMANPGRISISIGTGPSDLISPNMAGLAIQGGVVAVVIWGYYFFSKPNRSTNFWNAANIITPTILIGHMIGRWGNFFNQEVYGASTSASSLWWVPSWIAENMLIDGEYRIPLFFIEGILNLAGFLLIIFVVEKFWKNIPGVSFAAYLIWYGTLRIILENFRDPVDIMYWGPIQSSSIMSALFIIAGVYILITVSHADVAQKKIKKENMIDYDIDSELS